MRILSLSDFHGSKSAARTIAHHVVASQTPQFDVAVVSGDITNFGPEDDGSKVLGQLTLPFPILWIRGNCDPSVLTDMPGTCLETEPVCINGVLFVSSNTTEDRMQLAQKFGDFHSIALVSHVPPLNTKADVLTNGRHVGSRSIRALARRLEADLVLCGHIHESRSVDESTSSLIVNPGPAFDGNFAVLKYADEKWNASLHNCATAT